MLARIVRPRGNKGEAVADDLCDDFERFAAGKELTLVNPAGVEKKATVEKSWRHQGRLILKFEGVESISDAELLRGSEIRIPFEDLGPAPEGEYYFAQLIGSEVRDADSERVIGKVQGILEAGGPPVLEVHDGPKETLIPFLPELCVAVDAEAGVIRVRLPEGLENLNT